MNPTRNNKTRPAFVLILILAALSMIGPFGIDTYLPAFKNLGEEFKAEPMLIQQTLSAFTLCFAATMLFYGTLSDSFGRRPILIASLILFILTNIAAVFATSINALILIRAAQGLAAGAGAVISRAIIQDIFDGAAAQRAMAQMMMVFSIAPALAPIIGGWLLHWFGWRSIFVFLSLWGVLLLVACYYKLAESLPREKFQPFKFKDIMRNYQMVFMDWRFMLMSLAAGISFAGVPLYVGSASAFVVDILHLSETSFGWLFIPLTLGIILGSSLLTYLSKSQSSQRLIICGLSIAALATLCSVIYHLFFEAALPYSILPIMLYAFGLSLASPCMTLITLKRFPKIRGLAASMQGFIQMMIFAIVSGVIAPLLYDNIIKIVLAHCILTLLGIALWFCANNKNTL